VRAGGNRYIAAHDDDRPHRAAAPCPRGTGVRSLIVLVPPDIGSAAFPVIRGACPVVGPTAEKD
jgi:hypothetical protein